MKSHLAAPRSASHVHSARKRAACACGGVETVNESLNLQGRSPAEKHEPFTSPGHRGDWTLKRFFC
jgi:hypothetical protein